jgi:ASC-1-like (ASCH) protein
MKRVDCEISEPYFTNIRDEKKTYEIVLNIGTISTLNAGDLIIWKNKSYGKELSCLTRILEKNQYSSIENALSNVSGFNKLDPNVSSETEIIAKWNKNTDKNLEASYGVVLFEFKKM